MNHIYQFKIALKDSKPLIWRRIHVPENTSFSDFHDIIQIAMGWDDDHMYEFTFGKIRIYDFQEVIDDGSNPKERDSMDTFLDEMVSIPKSKMTYIYDFGDRWEHVITLEKILPEEEGYTYPVCIDGARACPPEDCGGIWGYEEKLRILTDKLHPEYADIIEWMRENWNAEHFDCDETNILLKDYVDQWDEIYEETDETYGSSENDDFLAEENEYYELKKFTCPSDVLHDEEEFSNMEIWQQSALEDEDSLEFQTFDRLRNLGFDEKSVKPLILEALSIEWYYDLKYGTDHLEDRYSYNLQHLPQTPQELPRSVDALNVLDLCRKGVPFNAIEHLQNDTAEETTSAILKALKNYSDHQYCWGDCTNAPFWYALAAEGHICEALIEPLIQLYRANENKSEWLNMQGQYLTGKLAQKYPDQTAQKVLKAMENEVVEKSDFYLPYLFDAFYFCDLEKYKSRLVAFLEGDDFYWYDPLAITIAYLQIQEALPVLKRKLEMLKTKPAKTPWQMASIVEIKEAIQILEGELPKEELESLKPYCLTREGTWKDELKEEEASFYEDVDFEDPYDFQNFLDRKTDSFPSWSPFSTKEPYIKEKTPERNDPCPCGSGKKYKKCCMG